MTEIQEIIEIASKASKRDGILILGTVIAEQLKSECMLINATIRLLSSDPEENAEEIVNLAKIGSMKSKMGADLTEKLLEMVEE